MTSEGDQWTRTQVHGNGFCTSVDYSAGLEIQRSRVQFPAGGLGVAFYATGWVSKCLFFRHSNLLHLILTFTYQIPLPEPLLIVKSWGNCKMARTNRQLLTGTASNKGTLLLLTFWPLSCSVDLFHKNHKQYDDCADNNTNYQWDIMYCWVTTLRTCNTLIGNYNIYD